MSNQNVVGDAAARILSDLADPQTINRARDDAWRRPLWSALEEAGLTLAWVPEALGGSGAGLMDGFEVAKAAGRLACPVPLGETLLAGWVLAGAGLPSPKGPMTVAPVRPRDIIRLGKDGRLVGRARNVPFASAVDHIAALADTPAGGVVIALAERQAAGIERHAGVAGDPADTVILDGVKPVSVGSAPAHLSAEALMLMGATLRAEMIAGALGSILASTASYANERIAFERPIAKFQAVQQNLARLAGEVAAADAAAGSAAATIAAGSAFDDVVLLEAASAKIRAGEAAGEGAAIAHQVMGAIGFTKEHVLHRFTQRMWAWRDEFGSESHWAVRLGEHVARIGADDLWPMLAAR
jgi:alkylation response protein AidB-like acyl-CoA dehydrogenase